MISEFERTLLLLTSGVIVLGTLVVWILALVRQPGRKRRDDDGDRDDDRMDG